MKIVLWIGNESHQKALAGKIHSNFPIAGIVTETRKRTRKFTFHKAFEKIIEKLFLPSIDKSWNEMKAYYDRLFPHYPDTEILDVENINSSNVYDFTKKFNADLILVSGTRIIKEQLLSLNPKIGILNLHTGLSPYIKGGPNCTNWCISMGQFELIGNTIMWIDKGIDTGNIVNSGFTEFSGNETLSEVHIKVMEHAHNLYINSLKNISESRQLNVSQSSIGPGKTYFNKEWGLKEKRSLIKNMKEFNSFFKNGNNKKAQDKLVTVKSEG